MTTTMTFGAPVEQDRFSNYFGMAVAAHVVLILAAAFMPEGWLGRETDADKEFMYISLGGAVGEDTSGSRAVAARAVQEATSEPVRPQFQAPAEKPAAIAVPDKTPVKPEPAPVPATKTPINKTPIQSTTTETSVSRTPIRGAEVRQGQAKIDTRVATGSDGLALQSGGTGGETNLSNFCCPGYITAMSAAIKRNWKQQQGTAGQNTVRFTIERDGRITGIELVQASGVYALDRESQAALVNAKLPPLPAQFTEPKLIIRLIFEYTR